LSRIDYDKIIASSSQRTCDEQGIVALYWEVPQTDVTPGAKGSLLVRNTILGETDRNKNFWSEIYVPLKTPIPKPEHLYVHFRWTMASENSGANFVKDSCQTGNAPLPDGSSPVLEGRVGFTLTSDPRTGNPALTRTEWERCNAADNIANPQYANCGWKRFEMLIPYLQPRPFCHQKTLWEYWSGKREFVLSDKPQLCYRDINLGGSYRGPWKSFGTITSVWCD
jgi:hypothetical protein